MNIPHPRLYQINDNNFLNQMADSSLGAALNSEKAPAWGRKSTIVDLASVIDQNRLIIPQYIKDRHGVNYSDNDMLGFAKESAYSKLFEHHKGVVIEASQTLYELMENTDVDNISINDINLPFNLLYFNFQKRPVVNGLTSPIAGIYLAKMVEVVSEQNIKAYKDVMGKISIGDRVSVLSMNYIFDGYKKPFEQRSLFSVNNFIKDDNVADFISEVSNQIGAKVNTVHNEYLKEFSQLTTELVIKTMLYMNTKNMRSVTVNELTDFKKKYLSFGKKRADKQAGKFPSKYDRIIVGPESLSVQQGQYGSSSEKTTHWRRGHFRNQRFGEGLKDSHIVWIQPVIVNAIENEVPAPKTYKIKM